MAWYNSFKDFAGDVGDIVQGKNPTNNQSGKPDPTALSQGSTMTNTNSPITSSPTSSLPPIPMASTSGLSSNVPPGDAQNLQAFQSAAMSNPDLAGVIQTIEGWGGDVAGAIEDFVNKNGGWLAVGKDVAGFIKNNAPTILSALSAYNSYQRQQKADQLGQQAVTDAKAQYAAQQPLRDAGMAGMLDPSKNAPNLTQLGKAATAGQALQAPQPIPLGGGISNVQAAAGNNPFAPAKPIPLAGSPPSNTPPPAAPIPMAPTPYVPQKPGATTAPATAAATPTPGRPPTGPLAPPALPIALQGPPTPPPKYTMPAYPAAPNVAPIQPIPLAGQ